MKSNHSFVRGISFTFCFLLFYFFSQAQHKPVVVSIDAAVTHQTIRNFGASDAWSCQYAGSWPDSKKQQMANWLFSMDTTASGQPQGIGLSLWRFNIGAGSAQQGNASGIKDEWRRAESFLEQDSTWNWKRQAGQLWFLQAAKASGVQQFLAFLNSPPVQLTKNGKAFASGGYCNIDPAKYSALAAYLVQVLNGVYTSAGILFNYISPVNEPQWDWSDGGQEGCPYTNEQISGLVRSISSTFADKGLSTKILLPEAGQINYLYEKGDKPGKGEQTNTFFDPHSAEYLGNLPQVQHSIAAHSYFTTSPYNKAVQMREKLAAGVANIAGLEYWQSEYCILGDNAGEINGSKKDLGMEAALYLAGVIHNDLTVANAAAWQYWLAISPYDYKDGLIYIDKNKTDGQYHDSKMLWAMGNYSRFIRPGARRVQVTVSDSAALGKNLLISAYKNIDNTVSIVVVNSSAAAVDITLHCRHAKLSRVRSYTTSDQDSLAPGNTDITVTNSIRIPARAVVTLAGRS
ncbi:O-Glycosyl hydrolase [Chitinophaga rupis]|uniref:O-Glycosyl hydrolase n=1 Tax=Chitinophaga rupis TaxID=573321 RepID=A0A1H8DUZ2_9BACT|nr:glycoside hydrolase family 30 protein [Chitinophaga rupis]SEN10966.1 O-Glycosyl hydrolase [Chitinophaga rupis]